MKTPFRLGAADGMLGDAAALDANATDSGAANMTDVLGNATMADNSTDGEQRRRSQLPGKGCALWAGAAPSRQRVGQACASILKQLAMTRLQPPLPPPSHPPLPCRCPPAALPDANVTTNASDANATLPYAELAGMVNATLNSTTVESSTFSILGFDTGVSGGTIAGGGCKSLRGACVLAGTAAGKACVA
jgi:hypothetical protein